MTGGMIYASLCSAPHHGAAHCPASLRITTQRSDFPAASAPGWPENHPMPQRSTPRRSAALRFASHRNVAQRNANPERT